MNPIFVAQRLKTALTRYLLTTFDVNRDGQNFALYQEIRKSLEADKAIMTGPFLELAQPYRRGLSTQDLIDKGVLSDRLVSLKNPPIPLNAPLYQHQQQAAERIADNHSVIVSSGTGSGKTESFLLPILSDLLERPSKGVRALLIYPLNALVNDQLRRLSKILEGTEITYGYYTSELKNTTKEALKDFPKGAPPNQVISREQIRTREMIPNILITNYAMLEYLLLRPEDSGLFDDPSDWKYIVLDEAHSYIGTKGIEVAYLLRRLKQRLGKSKSEMVCIGTSATLTNDTNEAIAFAHTLFGEDFQHDDIIFGKTDSPSLVKDNTCVCPSINAYLDSHPEHEGIPKDWDKFLTGLRNNQLSAAEVINTLREWGVIASDFSTQITETPKALHHALKTNGHVHKLLAHMCENPDTPLGLTEAANLLFPSVKGDISGDISIEDAINALHHLIELCSYARLSPDSPALLPARYHVFARSPLGIWVCLNPACAGRLEKTSEPWSQIFSTPRLTCDSCSATVYPIVVCRECGQVYVKTVKSGEEYHPQPPNLEPSESQYFVWSKVDVNDALASENEENVQPARTHAAKTRLGEPVTLCLCCRRTSRCQCGEKRQATQLYPVVEPQINGIGTRDSVVTTLETCVRCQKTSRIDYDEIATEVTIKGSTPLAVITTELYRHLPESSDSEARNKPGNGRKLLSFYDSRQGAARYAAFLQDVFNQDVFRNLVPTVLRKAGKTLSFPTLTRLVIEQGWKQRIFQNTLEQDLIDAVQSDVIGSFESLPKGKRDKIEIAIKARLIAKLTTDLSSRQSLEALGLLYVSYFETPPDLTQLAVTIGLTEAQTLTLIETLLDTVRMDKAVALPQGVQGDHEAFGKNEGNPFILRSGTTKGSVSWMGSTERHKRARIVSNALKHAKQADDLDRVRTVLSEIFSWLSDSPIFTRVGNDGYRLDLDTLTFSSPTSGWKRCDTCQRLRYGEVALPCHRCGGSYQSVDIESEVHNYYRYVFKQPPYSMRVEEHTAQLSPKQGREYEEKFKAGDINVLSCSTTFEMGIDLGDLQAVVMNNVPPEVSNYRQRAGRAGRRAGGTAFILTWAVDRSHDQTYYEHPSDIIRGHVRIPFIKLDNKEISRRHFNALLLADFLRYHKSTGGGDTKTVGEMFNPQFEGGRTYDRLQEWENKHYETLASSISALAKMIDKSVDANQAKEIFNVFKDNLREKAEEYDTARQHYLDEIQKAKQAYSEASGKDSDEHDNKRKENEKLLDRLNKEQLIDWLSNQGMLPSYAFPIHVVELEIPIQHEHNAQRDNLRLQRDLSRAIVEFAPGAEVVANKRLWESAGVRFKKTPKVYQYRLCATCNHIHAAENPGENITAEVCPICQTRYTGKTQSYLVPDGFFVDKDSGKLAGQYVRQDKLDRRYAISIPQKAEHVSSSHELVELSFEPDAKLYFINRGVWDKHGTSVGYRLCAQCGLYIDKPNSKKCPRCSPSQQPIMSVDLGHHVLTNTLVVRFTANPQYQIRPKTDLDFWHTLLQALLLGASRTLQIERRDIDGVLFPISGIDNDWDRSLVLFDNVPGGAGYVEDIKEHFPAVVEAALELVRCKYCSEETSCTRCLRDYGNQLVHPHLKRGKVIEFLEQLDNHYKKSSLRNDGVQSLFGMNQMQVLWDDIRRAKHWVSMAAHSLSDSAPIGKTQSWLDLLDERLRAGVEVRLLLQTLPSLTDTDKENVVTADKLRWMLEKHPQFNVRKNDQLPPWHTLIDGKRVTRFDTTTQQVTYDFRSVSLEEAVTDDKRKEAERLFEAAFERAQPITPKQFQHSSTQVYRVKPIGRRVSEMDIEGIVKFFERPVVSMTVHDPYLLDYERLHNRLGNYIELAAQHQQLVQVNVYTRDAHIMKHDKNEQNRAIETLQRRFAHITIKVHRKLKYDAHDRWIEICREDDSRARLYIGRGLDFIRSDGSIQETYLVLEEMNPH